ncbi:hypothetical protein ACFZA2_15385 [Microbacterium sp. NPDC007973]|uniref:hypothetical protein n=1 Tax=Microbacterium sp. NPDC007973 TaxID=3364182 RepID=UPI0036E74009
MATQNEAQAALFEGVKFFVERAKAYDGTRGASMLRDAGVAYRAAVGGPQPGILDLDVKSS